MSWYALSSVVGNGERLCIRLIPDAFAHDVEFPVLEVSILEPQDHQTAVRALERFRSTFIVEIETDASAFAILGEMDDETTVVRGSSVKAKRTTYSADELQGIAQDLAAALSREAKHARKQSSRLHELTRFVHELIDRAQIKKALSNRSSTAAEAQIDVLKRVLNRLDDT